MRYGRPPTEGKPVTHPMQDALTWRPPLDGRLLETRLHLAAMWPGRFKFFFIGVVAQAMAVAVEEERLKNDDNAFVYGTLGKCMMCWGPSTRRPSTTRLTWRLGGEGAHAATCATRGPIARGALDITLAH